MVVIYNQLYDFLNGYTKLATKLQRTHRAVWTQTIGTKDTYYGIQKYILLSTEMFLTTCYWNENTQQTNQH
jgi:hypothetical protein